MENIEICYNKVQEAISVMKEVAEWGRNKGFNIWLDEWLTPEELITEKTKPQNFCIGKINNRTVCAFILQNSDVTYWGNRLSNEAVYLHKLCVKREFAHREIAKSIVEAIRTECRNNGVKYIRLDTGLDEKVVRKIYLRIGFKLGTARIFYFSINIL